MRNPIEWKKSVCVHMFENGMLQAARALIANIMETQQMYSAKLMAKYFFLQNMRKISEGFISPRVILFSL